MICVCWSPDGKYIVTGGQDDLVSIWSLAERKIVARCQGHHSWVSAVAFDPWRCDERTYRFGSVGDDCRLLLWDFNVGMLHRPKTVSVIFFFLSIRRIQGLTSLQTQGPTRQQRNSVVTTHTYRLNRHRTDSTGNRQRADSDGTEKPDPGDDIEKEKGRSEEFIRHPVEPRKMTALLPPIMVCQTRFLSNTTEN